MMQPPSSNGSWTDELTPTFGELPNSTDIPRTSDLEQTSDREPDTVFRQQDTHPPMQATRATSSSPRPPTSSSATSSSSSYSSSSSSSTSANGRPNNAPSSPSSSTSRSRSTPLGPRPKPPRAVRRSTCPQDQYQYHLTCLPPPGQGRLIHTVTRSATGHVTSDTVFQGNARATRRHAWLTQWAAASPHAIHVREGIQQRVRIMLDVIASQRGGPTAIATNARLRRQFQIDDNQLLPLAVIYRHCAHQRARTIQQRVSDSRR